MKRLTPVILALFLLPAALRAEKGLTRAQQIELRTYTRQLADPDREAETKLEAATLLLTRSYPQAPEALVDFLTGENSPPARIAVAEAIARNGTDNPAFITPLMKMLTGKDASVRPVAARALASYTNSGVLAKLTGIALDAKRPKALRLVVIGALERTLDRRAVDALIRLLDDRDEGVRAAAAKSLAKLTNIRTFGPDRKRWKRWWARNKDKDRTAWLADLAESLARSKTALEVENARLRDRLAAATREIYNAAAPAGRDEKLLEIFQDPVAEVRRVGTQIAHSKIAANEEVSEPVRARVRELLGDPSAEVREEAAMLVASLSDASALPALLKRLETETVPGVTEALLKALGQLRNPAALPAVLGKLEAEDDEVAAAAAAALAPVAQAKPLEAPRRNRIAGALRKTFRRRTDGANGHKLREALLAAMGALGDPTLSDVIVEGLTDATATVRLAAVRALQELGEPKAAGRIEPLLRDADRGVRQAAIAALGALGPRAYLRNILARTDPGAETDAAVREQAWTVVLSALGEADAETIAAALESLERREDARDQRIRLMEMLVDRLRSSDSDRLPAAQRRLGTLLVAAGRPAEGASQLAESYRTFAKRDPDAAREVWRQWVSALLAADDAAAVKAVAAQSDEKLAAEARAELLDHVKTLRAKEKWAEVVTLSSAALDQWGASLSAERSETLTAHLNEARKARRAADARRVATLVKQLGSADADADARKAAGAELQAMGPRAVDPLLTQLRSVLAEENSSEQLEQAIAGILRQIAPKLTGYDPDATREAKLEAVEAWIQSRRG